MRISVQLAGAFRVGRPREQVLEVPEGTRAEAVIAALGLPEQILGIVLINGLHASPQDELREGDALALLPLLDGG